MKVNRLASIGVACTALTLSPLAAQSTIKPVRLAPNGIAPNGPADPGFGYFGYSQADYLSSDGRFVAYSSYADNLTTVGGGQGSSATRRHVYVHDRLLRVTRLASVSPTGELGNQQSGQPSITNDGRLVAFVSGSTNLVPGKSTIWWEIFVRDLEALVTTRESLGPGGVEPNHNVLSPFLSGDGSRLVFSSKASNLLPNDTLGRIDIFVRDRASGVLSCVSVNANGQPGNGDSEYPSFSNNGRYVVFKSSASDLVPGDTNGREDLFVRDLTTGAVDLIDQDVIGPTLSFAIPYGTISDDGRYVAFFSMAPTLVFGDVNGDADIFLRDRWTGSTTLVSAVGGVPGSGNSYYPVISADGSVVVYQSNVDNLVPEDVNGRPDVFKWERATGVTSLVAITNDSLSGNDASLYPCVSADGRTIAFQWNATDSGYGVFHPNEREFVSEVGPLMAAYCTAGTSGNGCAASIRAVGAPSASGATPFTLRVEQVDGVRPGTIFYGVDNTDLGSLPWGTTTSSLCVKLPVQRTPMQASGGTAGACDGVLLLDWNAFLAANSGALGVPFSAGSRIHAQGWYRDPANSKSSSLSNALAIELAP